jgi:hypothetical protein
MMMADSLPFHTNFEWMPTTTASDTDGHTTIPIVIVNGLCDCAAAIRRLGGSTTAVRQRLVDCAAISENDGTLQSPFMKTVTSNETPMPSVGKDKIGSRCAILARVRCERRGFRIQSASYVASNIALQGSYNSWTGCFSN